MKFTQRMLPRPNNLLIAFFNRTKKSPLYFGLLFFLFYTPMMGKLLPMQTPMVPDNSSLDLNLNSRAVNIRNEETEAYTKAPVEITENSIPKFIHVVGKHWLHEMESWKTLNPEYIVEFYDDDRCLNFIQEYYPQYVFTYMHLQSVRRFDFIRYLIIYHHGGIYADGDITCMEPIKDWGVMNETTFFTGIECVGCNDIGAQAIQWTFGATRGHPILNHVIKNVIANSMKSPSFFDRFGTLNKVIHMTGPSAFSDGIMAHLIEKGTCDPKVMDWNDNMGFVICTSVIPSGFASGVQIFPWYRWGSARDGDMPEIPAELGGDSNTVKFISHGYRASWVGM
jgi:hypothetical protein